jgi:hypothetical protein
VLSIGSLGSVASIFSVFSVGATLSLAGVKYYRVLRRQEQQTVRV